MTAAERTRNQIVFTSYQHNRNPFVDHAEFADMVFSGASPLDAWRGVHFTAAELDNPALSGPNADLDRDGFATLLEYLFGTDPRQPGAAPPLTASLVPGAPEGPTLVLSFPHNRFATDVAIYYEASEDLTTWVLVGPNSGTVTVTDFETEQLTVRFPAPAVPFFVRVRVEQ